MKITGDILNSLKDIRDFSRWSVSFFEEYKDIHKTFQKSWADDHKISSDEAIEIEKELKEVLGGLLLFNSELLHQFDEVRLISFQYQIKEDTFDLELLKTPKNIQLKDFLKWHQQFLNKKIRTLFSEYLEALADQVITDEENLSLRKKLESYILEIIYVIKWIRSQS